MKTIFVPVEFLTFNNEGKVEDIDVIGFLNSLPRKKKLYHVIQALRYMQEEQYQGFKKFTNNTPGNGYFFRDSYEAMGRMYLVIRSIIDEYIKL